MSKIIDYLPYAILFFLIIAMAFAINGESSKSRQDRFDIANLQIEVDNLKANMRYQEAIIPEDQYRWDCIGNRIDGSCVGYALLRLTNGSEIRNG